MTRTLILGGTAWLGREIAEQLLAAGHEVTCLARGQSGRSPDGARLVRADRREPGAYDEVRNGVWGQVIELAYDSELVEGALEALSDRTRYWTLVSSISVYAKDNEPGAAEEALLVEPTNLEDYAHAKVAAEQATSAALGERLLIARPGLIAGPGDPSDRFSYWVSRMALAFDENVLVPQATDRYVQFIDIRDLASWLVAAGADGLTGIYNVVGREHSLSAFLFAAAQVAEYSGTLIAVDDRWLGEHGVNYWAGPRSLPLWLPLSETGFARRSGQQFMAAGGRLRSLRQTLEDVLTDERMRGLARERRSGFSRIEENLLLAEISESAQNGLTT